MSKVFVGNLAWSVKAQELRDHLSTSGGVVDAEVLSTRDGRSKGSGVVTFDSEDSAARAIQDMVDTELNGRNIWLREFREDRQSNGPSTQSTRQQNNLDAPAAPAECNVHVGNLPWSTTSEQVRYMCEEFGELQYAEVAFGNDGRSRGYGLVVFRNADEAGRCVESLHGTMFENRDLTVRISRPRAERLTPAAATGNASGYIVFVGNLPWSMAWQDLKDLAQNYGDVQSVDVGLDRQGRSKGIGTISFHELQGALECIQKMNGHEVEGRPLLVKEDYKNPLPAHEPFE